MIRYSIYTFALVLMANACTTFTEYSMPNIDCHNKFAATNTSLDQMIVLATANSFMTIDSDKIFDAYVVSSDQGGNFYKSLIVQDKPENPTCGIEIAVDKSAIYTDFPIGTHLRINAKGLKIGNDKGSIKLGIEDPTYAIGRIPQVLVSQYITGVCNGAALDVKAIKPKEFDNLTDALTPANLNQYICVKNTQFNDKELGLAFINLSPEAADSKRSLVDAKGKSINLLFSEFAKFSRDLIPEGNGSACFILSRYNTDYQGLVNDKTGFMFNQPRLDFAPPLVGSALAFVGPGLENFESYTADASSQNFIKYINDAYWANKYWRVATFANNKYLQLSSFTGQDPSISYFIVPVDFSLVNQVSFSTKDAYYNGNVLKVYYSTNYQAGQNISQATLVDISAAFNIAKGSTNGYAQNFTPSGIWQKPPTLNQKAYLIFEYKAGGKYPTTTMQIDNILLQ
jgi:Family of unknown function (DUF5689)